METYTRIVKAVTLTGTAIIAIFVVLFAIGFAEAAHQHAQHPAPTSWNVYSGSGSVGTSLQALCDASLDNEPAACSN